MSVPTALRQHPDVVGTPATRVLLALVACHRDNGRATVRDVTAWAGYRSFGEVHDQLVDLRDLGLVAWDDGRQGTLRPMVTLVRFG